MAKQKQFILCQEREKGRGCGPTIPSETTFPVPKDHPPTVSYLLKVLPSSK